MSRGRDARLESLSRSAGSGHHMTDERAEQVANVLLAAAAVGVAIYVVRTPSLRRLAWRFAVTALTGTLPAWIGREVQHAWTESGHSRI